MQSLLNARLRELQPAAVAELARANAAAWSAANAALLELCKCLVVTMLDSSAVLEDVPNVESQKLAALGNWAGADVYSPLERAALQFTEQFVLSVSTVTDEQVEALRAHLDDEAVYNFAAALYLVEMTERLKLVSRAVIGEEAPA